MNVRRTFLAGAVALTVIGAAACSDSEQTTAPSGAATNATTVATAARETQTSATATPTGASSAPSAAPAAAAPTKLNLNTATREQFLTVPGVGDRMVREFEEYRPYTSVAQFRREIGKYVAQEQVNAYLQYVFVPVDPNRADAETLQQLPGVDASDAAQIIAARPYASAEAFMTTLGQYVSADQAPAARAYLVTS